jgi:hypothetical protein
VKAAFYQRFEESDAGLDAMTARVHSTDHTTGPWATASASGISAVASPADLVFVNTDLTLHLTREPVGQEIWLRARTTLDPVGIGRTTGELGDRRGSVGHSAQRLFVEPRA